MNTLKYRHNVEKMLQYLHDLACSHTNPEEKPIHLLHSLLHFEECTLSEVLRQNQINVSLLQEAVEELRKKEPNIGVVIDPVPNLSLRKIYTEAEVLARSVSAVEIDEIHLFVVLFTCEDDSIKNLLAKESLRVEPYQAMMKTMAEDAENEEKKRVISEFCFQNEERPKLVGREKEVQQIFQILSSKSSPNICIYGEKGIGKSAIIQEILAQIQEGNAPLSLRNRSVLLIKLQHESVSIPYDILRENPKDYVIYIPSLDPLFLMSSEAHRNFRQWLVAQQEAGSILILEASSHRHNSLKLLAKNQEDYLYGFFINSLFQHTQHYQILEQKEELFSIVSLKKTQFEENFSVLIDDSAVETACLLSEQLPYDALYTFDLGQPLKSLLLLEDACVFYEGEERSNGEDTVKQIQRETVLSLVECKFGEKYLKEATQSQEEKTSVLNLPERLSREIIGQKEAIQTVSQAMIRAKAGVRDPQRPVASFLFLGTTGVGKTELAKVLTTQIYGKTSEMRRFDMSEYREKHNVARLIGSPPGYIGSDQGGQLTELVKKYPNSIFLFDEVEKAHQDIFNIFLQILDEGRLTDSKGETVDFTKAVVILTSNLGAKNMLYGVEKGELTSSAKKSVLREVSNFFKPEFINRLDELIYFLPLQRENVGEIVKSIFRKLASRLYAQKIVLKVHPESINFIVEEAFSPENGARPLKTYIQNNVETCLATYILTNPEKKNLYLYEQDGLFQVDEFTVNEDKSANFPKIVQKRKRVTAASPLNSQEIVLLRQLEEEISKRVLGQQEAVTKLVQGVKRGKTGVCDPNKPIASFLFLGTTGVGKTELAKVLADSLFEESKKLVRLDMSEFSDPFSVQRLVGGGITTPEKGGVLTSAVEEMQQCVVLFDEIEKASTGVLNLLLQILDDGRLTDGRGYTVNFCQTILILTSNLAAEQIRTAYQRVTSLEETPDFRAVEKELKKNLREELINRFTEIIYFRPFQKEQVEALLDLLVQQANQRLKNLELFVSLTNDAKHWLIDSGFSPELGGRALKNTFDKEVLTAISDLILENNLKKGDYICVDVNEVKKGLVAKKLIF